MTALIAALHITDKVTKYGAYAGYACIVGLAVLAILYFGQARELKRLREWAGRAPERAAEQEARMAAEAQKRVVAQPVVRQPASAAATPAGQTISARPLTPAIPAPAPASAPAPAAGKPAPTPGTPAPATAAGATAPTATPSPAGAPTGAGAPGTSVAPSPGALPGQVAAGNGPANPVSPAGPPPVSPTPGVPAGGSNGPAAPAPVAADADEDTGDQPTTVRPVQRPPQPLRADPPSVGLPPRTAAGAAAAARRGDGPPSGRSAPSRTAILAGAGLGLVVLVVVLIVAGVFSSGGGGKAAPKNSIGAPATSTKSTSATSGASGSTAKKKTTTTAALNRGNTVVAVINGTLVQNFAHTTGAKLNAKGYKLGTVTSGTDQSVATSSVFYTVGHKPAALDVAKQLGLPATAVKPIDSSTSVTAGPDADVVVLIGADLAH